MIGDGEILAWHEIEGTITGKKYADLVDDHIAPAFDTLKERAQGTDKRRVIYQRDGDPKRGTRALSGEGRLAEERHGIRAGRTLNEQPGDSPDVNLLDYWMWDRIVKKMNTWLAEKLKEDPDWEETKDEFRARLRETAFSIPASEIRKAMGSMVRRCKELANGDGNYIKGD